MSPAVAGTTGAAGESVRAGSDGSSGAAGTLATSAGSGGAAGANDAPPPPAAGSAGTTAGAGGMAAPASTGDADPSPGCNGGTLMPGESMQMLQSGGAARVYVQHVPAKYDGKTPLPLVLDLHGGSYDGPRWVNASGFKQLGDKEGFITLFPSGTNNSWLATTADSADGTFLRDLISDIGKKGCIDRKRVYSTGCSMGGAMSFWMACFASDLVAAAAPMCGTPFFELSDCKPKRPISIMLTMGETDNLNCWDGTPGSVGNPCAKEVQAAFKQIDMCPGEIKKTHNDVCETLDQCGSGTEVTICKSNTGHGVYTASNLKVTEESWSFLKRFYLK
ncbi:MAG TPA: PHB depolymerase family esterase [Polyangiales bacterium]|nr:PHB depolymerase family esterase [Polyangiales bacterium]